MPGQYKGFTAYNTRENQIKLGEQNNEIRKNSANKINHFLL